MITPEEVKAWICSFLEPSLSACGMTASSVSDDTDLRTCGLIDSLGFMQLMAELQSRLGAPVDLSALDPDRLTRVGVLSRYVAERQP